MGDGRAEQHGCTERIVVRVVALLDRPEAHDDVGEGPLGVDERDRVRLATLEVGQDLRRLVATLRAVTLDLPRSTDLLGGIEIDRDVKTRSREARVQRQQALDDDEFPRLHENRPLQGACAVVVHGLQNRLAESEELEVLLHDLDVVALRVEGSEGKVAALGPVVAVVVVDTDRGDALRAEGSGQPAGQGRLAGGAVAGDGEHRRPDAT